MNKINSLKRNNTSTTSFNNKNLNSKELMNQSVKLIKEDVMFDQLQEAKDNHFKDQYSHIINGIENEKNKLMKESNSKKNLINNNHNKRTSILEYEFIEDNKGSQIQLKSNFRKNHNGMMNNNLKPKIKGNIYQRNIEHSMIREEILEEKRTQQVMEELATMKQSPGVTEMTKKIIMEKFQNEEPLQNRYQSEIENKKIMIENLRQFYEEEKQMELKSTFTRSRSHNKVAFEDWLNEKQVWMLNRNAKIEYKKRDLKEKENNDQELIFKPQIDKNSELIAMNKNINDKSGLRIHEKLYKKHEEKFKNIEKQKQILKPTFTPKINKIPQYFNKDKSQSKIFYYEAESQKKNQITIGSNNILTNNNSNNNILNKKVNYSMRSLTPKLTRIKTGVNLNNLNNSCISQNTKINNNDDKINNDKTLINSKSTNNLDSKENYNLYKLNVRTNSAWNNPMTIIKTKNRNKDIIKSALKYGK